MLHEKHVLPLEKTERDLQSVHIAVRDLARAFNDGTEDISIRTHATIIMERLCVYYAHSHFAKEVEGMLVAMIPKVNRCQLEFFRKSIVSYASSSSPFTLETSNTVDVARGQGNTSS